MSHNKQPCIHLYVICSTIYMSLSFFPIQINTRQEREREKKNANLFLSFFVSLCVQRNDAVFRERERVALYCRGRLLSFGVSSALSQIDVIRPLFGFYNNKNYSAHPLPKHKKNKTQQKDSTIEEKIWPAI